MSTFEVANAIEKGLQKAIPEVDILKVPIADGGEYTVDVLLNRLGGKFVFAPVIDCLCRPVKAKYGILSDGKTAIIEMTEVTGIKLVSKELLNPMKTTSYGAGLLIKHAIHQGMFQVNYRPWRKCYSGWRGRYASGPWSSSIES